MGCRAVVLGASGFAGAELLRLLSRHPGIELAAAAASTRVGSQLSELYPGLSLSDRGMAFVSVEEALAADADLIFSSLPHGSSMALFSGVGGPKVVDLAGDFRLHDALLYSQWYGEPHRRPEALGAWTYGLTEWHRKEVSSAGRVANPGCYPAACILALAPLVAAGVVEPASIHIDAISGVSGAGRASGEGFDFSSANENLRPYSVTGHKHIPEIEQELSIIGGAQVRVSFVPHLAPMTRGLLATCSADLREEATTADVVDLLRDRYDAERFVRVLRPDALPETGRLAGTNAAEVTARVEARTGRLLAFAAIDNLGKGAAGQAIQNANLMLGFDEGTALETAGLVP